MYIFACPRPGHGVCGSGPQLASKLLREPNLEELPCPALEDQASLRPGHGVCGAGLQLASKLPLHDEGSASLPWRDFPALDQGVCGAGLVWVTLPRPESHPELGHTPMSRVTGQKSNPGLGHIPLSRVTGSIWSIVSINCEL